MRELTLDEMNLVSGAGVLMDDPNFQDVLAQVDATNVASGIGAPPIIKLSLFSAGKATNLMAKIFDTAWSKAFIGLFG